MKEYVTLFLIGIAGALSFPFILDILQTGDADEDSISDFIHGFKEVDKVTKGIYYIAYLILLPIAVIPVLKKKLTGKWSLLYAFVGGNGFGFSIIGLMGLLS